MYEYVSVNAVYFNKLWISSKLVFKFLEIKKSNKQTTKQRNKVFVNKQYTLVISKQQKREIFPGVSKALYGKFFVRIKYSIFH